MRMIHYEGVAYRVDTERPWQWTDYAECEKFSPAQLVQMAAHIEPVDLADWVRTFGSRLESNFHLISYWYNHAEEV